MVLPIPAGINDSNQVSWQSGEMNAGQMALANIALKGITEGLTEAGKETAWQASGGSRTFGRQTGNKTQYYAKASIKATLSLPPWLQTGEINPRHAAGIFHVRQRSVASRL